ncbi:MAG: T9SS type A sorting domain-containing protein [Bacteroidia bacterium]
MRKRCFVINQLIFTNENTIRFTTYCTGSFLRPFRKSTNTNCLRKLESNNVRAVIHNGGDMFYNLDFTPGFEVPGGSGKHTLFGAALWIGGLDAGRNLHLAAMTYRQGGYDFYPGPLDTTTGTTTGPAVQAWDSIWAISRAEVEAFKAGGPITSGIANWPGNSSNTRHSKRMAPFVDADKNGLYEPQHGDYPEVRGSQTLYWVMNDQFAAHTETGGEPLGIEVHATAFVLDTADGNPLDNTVYLEFRIINRSQHTYDSLYYGMFADFDIGFGFDDFIGSNPDLNAFFGYNGDSFDDGSQGYGAQPPVQSIAFIGQDLSHFMYYNNDFTSQGNPESPIEYYHYLRGRWKDGSALTRGGDGYKGTTPATHAYPGDPGNSSEWSEESENHQPGDRRGIGSVGPVRFAPGDELQLTVASIFHPNTGSGQLGAFSRMEDDIQAVAEYYTQNFPTGLPRQPAQGRLVLFPNPAQITLGITSSAPIKEIRVLDLSGREMSVSANLQVNHAELNVSALSPGLYFIRIFTEKEVLTKRWIKH